MMCQNHEDGTTQATVFCTSCELNLCEECEHILHLRQSMQGHVRSRIHEAQATIAVDLHEGCGRAKLAQLMVVADRRSLKAVVEFRRVSSEAVCRFCCEPLGSGGGVSQLVSSGIQVGGRCRG